MGSVHRTKGNLRKKSIIVKYMKHKSDMKISTTMTSSVLSDKIKKHDKIYNKDINRLYWEPHNTNLLKPFVLAHSLHSAY